MARRLSWSDVRGGVIVCVTLLVLAVVVLKYSRVGALHGRTFRMYALVGEARGITKGSEVWLSGQKVGKIIGITFLPPERADTARRIQIEMEILEEHRAVLRRNAEAQIRPGGSIIGAPVVYLSPGTPTFAAMQPGDTVRMRAQPDLEGAAGQFSTATRELPVIMANVKVLAAELQTTRGTMGALMNGPGLGELQRARIGTLRLTRRLTGGGTAGLIMQGGLSRRAARVMARADSVRALLASPHTSFGRLRRDSTLIGEVADIRNELTLVRAALDEPRGTAGRVMRDSALTRSVGETQRQMTLLFADIKKHPLHYVSF